MGGIMHDPFPTISKQGNSKSMKIFLASAAPGSESSEGIFYIPRRLLSYHTIMIKDLNNHDVFNLLMEGEKENASDKTRFLGKAQQP
jgi:hypothetical protein